MRLAAAFLVLCLLIGTSFITADQQQAPPTFRAGVDLLTVETAVMDHEGRPVRDLQPSDFTVRVAGKPRDVLFARFYGAEVFGAPETSIATTPVTSTHAGNASTAAGRIVVFVVDRDSIKSGNEKALLETAATVFDGLTPADAVGLVGLPVGSVELTREHSRVREALSRITGTQPRQALQQERNISWTEALGYEQDDRRVIGEVVERECYNIPGPLPPQCPGQLRVQAMEMLQTGRFQVQTTMSVLGGVAERLAPLRGPKHLLLMSGGMPFGQDLLPYFDDFARKAAAAQIVLYVVHLDQPDSDASDRKAVASAFGGRDMTQGLTALTGLTGGAFFSGIGRATGVFDRIKAEMNNFYELGIETRPEDADGKARGIEVEVNRPGMSVRTRRLVTLPDTTARNADPLKALLLQPTDVADLLIAIAAYTTRGDDEKTLRVLLSAEIGTTEARPPAQWGFVILNDGNVVASGRQRLDQAAPVPWAFTTSAKLLPGQYRLRFAATDGAGRAGVADIPLSVGLRAAGDLQVSDLIVGTADGGKLQPRARIVRGAPLSALIELLSPDPARLAKSRAVIEIIPAGSAEPVQRFVMAARTGNADAVLLNSAQIETATLAPGRYTASVVAQVDDQPVGRVSRVFEVVAPAVR